MIWGQTLLAMALMLSPFPALARAGEHDRPYAIPDSAVFMLKAADGHAYEVMIAWPDTPPPPSGWPVLYVLDGADNFAAAVLTARRMARMGKRSRVAPGVVVGIESGDLARRVLDYTPPAGASAIPAGAPAHGMATGGGDAFLTFLDDRVAPAVAERVAIDPARRTLMGHSFGGLLALHALLHGDRNFDRYIAVSPSLWYGTDLVAREERAFVVGDAPRSLLIAVGDLETGPDGNSGSSAEALAARLKGKGVAARYLELGGQDHGTTMLASMGQALRLAFAPEAR